ncbi:Two pore potassium channel protein sup-9 [Diplonema papillatum]|nr:Two pore potassium channel protein sup-9 [Diplonema papillatum]
MQEDAPLISVKRRVLVLVGSVGLTIAYLFLGGIVMRALEAPMEDKLVETMQREISGLNITQAYMDHLEKLGLCKFPSHDRLTWTYAGGFFYAMTIVTTIGYGSLLPKTYLGKLFTAVFALFGIALVGNLLTNCSVLLVDIAAGILQRIRARKPGSDADDHGASLTTFLTGRLGKVTVPVMPGDDGEIWDRSFGCFDVEGDDSVPGASSRISVDRVKSIIELATKAPLDDVIFNHIVSIVDPLGTGSVSRGGLARSISLWYETKTQLPEGVSWATFLYHFVAATLWIIIWAGVFSSLENWEYRDGMWFCFITMTTIGFGDFVPNTNTGRIMAFVFIVPGLGFGVNFLSCLWKTFDYVRYWWLQGAYRDGKVSKKFLEIHGIDLPMDPNSGKVSRQGLRTCSKKKKKKDDERVGSSMLLYDDGQCLTPMTPSVELSPSWSKSGAKSRNLPLNANHSSRSYLLSSSQEEDAASCGTRCSTPEVEVSALLAVVNSAIVPPSPAACSSSPLHLFAPRGGAEHPRPRHTPSSAAWPKHSPQSSTALAANPLETPSTGPATFALGTTPPGRQAQTRRTRSPGTPTSVLAQTTARSVRPRPARGLALSLSLLKNDHQADGSWSRMASYADGAAAAKKAEPLENVDSHTPPARTAGRPGRAAGGARGLCLGAPASPVSPGSQLSQNKSFSDQRSPTDGSSNVAAARTPPLVTIQPGNAREKGGDGALSSFNTSASAAAGSGRRQCSPKLGSAASAGDLNVGATSESSADKSSGSPKTVPGRGRRGSVHSHLSDLEFFSTSPQQQDVAASPGAQQALRRAFGDGSRGTSPSAHDAPAARNPRQRVPAGFATGRQFSAKYRPPSPCRTNTGPSDSRPPAPGDDLRRTDSWSHVLPVSPLVPSPGVGAPAGRRRRKPAESAFARGSPSVLVDKRTAAALAVDNGTPPNNGEHPHSRMLATDSSAVARDSETASVPPLIEGTPY